MEQAKKKDSDKIALLHTIRFRFLILVLGCICISASVCYIVIVPKFDKQNVQSIQYSMEDLARSYSSLVEHKLGGMGTMVETSALSGMLKDVKVNGIQGSYVYLVSSNGIVLYHPDSKKVGNQVENEVIKGVVKKLSKGENVEREVVEYRFKGKKKYAGYCVSPQTKMITVVTADKAQVIASTKKLKYTAIRSEAAVCILLLIVAYLFAGNIITGIKKLEKVFDNASKLDLQEDDNLLKLCVRKDEIGLIAKKYNMMQNNLKSIVKKINSTSEQLVQCSNELTSNISVVNEHSQENSSTSQEMAAGMQEATANIDIINGDVLGIEENTDRIKEKTSTGTELASLILERAVELEEDTTRASKKAEEMYAKVKARSEIAIEKSKAVEKIEMLSSTIMDIADQTSLLALNASIEAARAGELGKGFGVVANEISALASQSASTVSGISAIVGDVTDAVANISECLETTLRFFEKDISRDYGNFKESSLQYSEDAKKIQISMDNINVEINQLSSVTREIASAVSEIAGNMNEAANGVTHIAEKTGNVVGLVSDTSRKVEENEIYAQDLKQIVSEFCL
ncbi:methyl-accepting chemotaxis protein [[Clostridium] polysaccharolyticum]|uniref:Methyl-accepting chemotaxis protein n=1 Tax=[Clostridium] polysaccharolyticum TaxID=29364 RepID=A0A1H9YP49_9FIRM|nr:methyl-accepting chemotaxis protein [[Clostridium] polysaccharolyticum]SES70267.1 methyl-accepting chemotaxis protein [[Clostridium] polysaccharolyticum]